jgi:sulfide:quinone oxidoreductase
MKKSQANLIPSISRRNLLLGAAGLALGSPSTTQANKIKSKARIVIIGSGLGGIAIANRLSNALDGISITIIDKKEEHNYQPGYTLVATGIWPVSKIRDKNADFLPKGIHWIKEMVADFDPANNTVITQSGEKVRYDFLVVATGTHQDWSMIEGMDIAAIGNHGLTSVYPSPEAAEATWKTMDQFRQKGGQAILTLPATPLKCAGAPLKMTFMLHDRLTQTGAIKNSTIKFYSALGNVFSVKSVNDNVLQRWDKMGIEVELTQKMTAIDLEKREATFSSPEGDKVKANYDFIHVVPPMRAPDCVKNSPLAWQEGSFALGGWLEVDPKTLQHRRFSNVFGIGDINGTPRGKTAATIKKSAPLVTQHIIDVINNKSPTQEFDGYTSCPLLLKEGSAMLIEFDYEGRLTPSLPMIEPLQASYFAWLMKYRMLKPAYMAVLKGRV